jgi:hypothetical protein
MHKNAQKIKIQRFNIKIKKKINIKDTLKIKYNK